MKKQIIDDAVMNREIIRNAFHEYTCGKKCVKCNDRPTQLRIEYDDILNNRDESIVSFLLEQWNEKTKGFMPNNKIEPYCYFCKLEKNDVDRLEEKYCVTYIGDSRTEALK